MSRLQRFTDAVGGFVRTHYTGLMLGIIVLSVAGSLVMLAFLSASLQQQVVRSNEQIELLKGVAQEISKDQQKQHDHQDRRQACFFNLFVTYTQNAPRQPITKEDADRCRVGDAQPVVSEPRASAEAQNRAERDQTAQSADSNRTSTMQPSQKPEERSFLDVILSEVMEALR